MFRSIRWKLVATYVALALVTVAVVGVLAAEIVRRYASQQEASDLQANAQAVAHQALPLLWPSARPAGLRQLANTAAFLGDVRVRILDAQGATLADSGSPGQASQVIWIVPGAGTITGAAERLERFSWMFLAGDQPVVEALSNEPLPGEGWTLAGELEMELLERAPSGSSLTVVERVATPWGGRLFFSNLRQAERQLPRQPAEGAPPRSQLSVREPVGDQAQPLGYVELSAGPGFTAEAIATTRRALLFAGGGAALLAGALGLLMSQRLAAPLRSLREAAGRMGRGDLSARAPASSADEIGELAAQFNQMAAQLQASFGELEAERDALRRFISDASHELRTPVTALMNFNTLLAELGGEDPAARAEFLAESRAQLERLDWITRNLLDLSRLQAGIADLDYGHHDLGELLASAAAPFKNRAAGLGLDLRVVPPAAPLKVRADRARLELALANLLDNALKFTPPGGQVELGAAGQGSLVHLWVQDTGPGLSPEDRPHVFERFYRGRGHSQPGSGLGLAIVASFVRAQGGRVWVESEAGQGARFVIEMMKTAHRPPTAGRLTTDG